MPLYEYNCPVCGIRFEEFRSIADRAGAKCVKCHGPAQQIISLPAVHTFKPHFQTNITSKPVWCESAEDVVNACRKNGMHHNYYDDGLYPLNKNALVQPRHYKQVKEEKKLRRREKAHGSVSAG